MSVILFGCFRALRKFNTIRYPVERLKTYGLGSDRVGYNRITPQLLMMQRSLSDIKEFQYEDLLEFKKKDNVILIDVREDNEIQETGKLPGSIHIPLGTLKTELELQPEEFQNKYGVKKPSSDTSVCFSCRSGRRSKMALDIAVGLGFQNACHYAGGFLDWQKHNPT